MIVFISNFFNHHQAPVAHELYNLTGGDYRFIELNELPQSLKDSGYPSYDDSPVLLQAWKSDNNMQIAEQLVMDAEVVVYGSLKSYGWITKRLKKGKLTFECGERWLKRGWLNLLSPRLLRSQWLYHTQYHNKPLYRLNASAFAASDLEKLHSFKGRCFKWGYFTAIPNIDVDDVIKARCTTQAVSFIVVSRLIHWKHVEMIVEAAKLLREKSFDFDIDIYGSGPEKERIQRLIDKFQLSQCVKLRGNVSNDRIHKLMRKHNALIFASDRNEGWGAVVNEAMANACPVIGSNAIGSIPYLINDGVNGLIFESGRVDHLALQMQHFIQLGDKQADMSRQAYNTMKDVWSPAVAAQRLIRLVRSIENNEPDEFVAGPCSPA